MRQKHSILKDIGNFMLSNGKLMNQREYSDAKNAPIRYPKILSFFGNWNRMMNSLRVHYSTLYTEIEKAEKAPKAAPKPKTIDKPKVVPAKAAPKPAAVSTVKKEEK